MRIPSSATAAVLLSFSLVLACSDATDDTPGGDPFGSSSGNDGGVRCSTGFMSDTECVPPGSSGDAGDGASPSDGGVTPGEQDAGRIRTVGPGAPPSRTCTVQADGAGFFELKTQARDLAYWVRLPKNYDAATPYPTVIGAHGCGDNAKNFATWAMAPWEQRDSQAHIAVSVGAGRDGTCWNSGEDESKVIEVLEDLRSCFYVHQKKVTLGGYSSGGMLAYYTAMRNTHLFAGLLIENSSIQSVYGDATDAAIAAADWKIDVVITARQSDGSFPIERVRTDRDKLLAAGFPVQFRELPGGHDGNGADWNEYLLPKIVDFEAP